ncbi:mitochondrial splicing system protein [Gnomoniopsis smithogilvyi]|uniref:Mitochondrial splicing system protein n=1 Tax=Gnomoniopsis smithogilvyi TaxID=1191159 RepID=A0A9W8YPV7_9PEZI|nr:mitochondrial splicing system protein [Gnomoniopsis smithogilvyi]
MFCSARVAVRARRLALNIKLSAALFGSRKGIALSAQDTFSGRWQHGASFVRVNSSLTSPHGQSKNTLDVLAGPFTQDTIYALSSAQGRAGIAVIRVSGPASLDIYHSLCPGKQPPTPRYAAVRTLHDPDLTDKAHILDSDAVVLYFPAPKTVTGEDILELHVHGGPATVKAVLDAIPRCASSAGPRGIRYAEPGEFTKRAFLNDRLDLSQVEALSDVLDAETEQQRRAAVRGNSGIRGQIYDAWREELLLARGEIEALIDFSEDQHFDESPRELLRNVTAMVQRILLAIDQHELAGQRTELLRKGIRIALLGPPNVGKSSLMNLIVGREASIVSKEAGTTRDIVEASLDIGGYLCTFADTAGIRTRALANDSTIGAIEEEGIRRAKLKALSSDVIIVLASVEQDGNSHFFNYDSETLQLAARAEQHLIAINKSDSVDQATLERLLGDFGSSVLQQTLTKPLILSCKEAETPSLLNGKDPGGIHQLTQSLVRSFENLTSLPEEMQELLGGTERQRQLLAQCREHLEDFMRQAVVDSAGADELMGDEPDIVLAAEHLRYAADCLARITGRGEAGDVEEVLGVIFEKFCVGK